MSQIPNENDDNRSVAASDFVKLDQEAEEVSDQQEEQPQFGLQQNALDWPLDTGSTNNNYENGLKEMKWMMANLQVIFGWEQLPGSHWNCFFKLIIFRPKIKRFKKK
jgi:hypothetical protein